MLALALLFLASGALGCVQNETFPHDVIVGAAEPFATVSARIVVDQGFMQAAAATAGIRAAVGETGKVPTDIDSVIADAEGDVAIRTDRIGPGHLVARSRWHDIGYGPVDIDAPGGVFEPTFLRPFDNETRFFSSNAFGPPTFPTQETRLMPKAPRRAKLMLLGDDRVGQQGFGRFEGRGNDSGQPVVVSVFATGDWNDFSFTQGLIELVDDGGTTDLDLDTPEEERSGDERANDRVFTRYFGLIPDIANPGGIVESPRGLGLQPGRLRYLFIINQVPIPLRDPYEEGSELVRIVNQNEVREFRASVINVF